MTTAPDCLAAWRRLAVKERAGQGALAVSRGDEFAVALAAAPLPVPADAAVAERDANGRRLAWLAGPGAMPATDHVELRRRRVDLGLVERDGYGRACRRLVAPPACRDAAPGLVAVDPGAVADEARREHAFARAERRARHEAREDGKR